MACFGDYYNAVSARPYWTVIDDLDSALSLVGCVRKGITGSDSLYHPVKAFTESEKAKAIAFANKVRELEKVEDKKTLHKEIISLSDDLHDFAIECLVARGAVHKGPPKI